MNLPVGPSNITDSGFIGSCWVGRRFACVSPGIYQSIAQICIKSSTSPADFYAFSHKSSSPQDFQENPQDPLTYFFTFLRSKIESAGSCGPADFYAFSHKSSSPQDFWENPQDPLTYFFNILRSKIESAGSCGPEDFYAFSHKSSSPQDFWENAQDPLTYFFNFLRSSGLLGESSGSFNIFL